MTQIILFLSLSCQLFRLLHDTMLLFASAHHIKREIYALTALAMSLSRLYNRFSKICARTTGNALCQLYKDI